MKNIDKYNELLEVLEGKCRDFVKSVIPELPKVFYEISNQYRIKEVTITGARYQSGFYEKPKPTKIDISSIERTLNENKLDKKDIWINYEHVYGGGLISTGSYNYLKFKTDFRSFDKNDLIKKAEENRMLYEPREGCVSCSYCGKVVDKDNVVKYEIIFLNSRWNGNKNVKFVDRKTNNYCSGECGLHDQMGHEG